MDASNFIIVRNAIKDDRYAPYCLRCTGLIRLKKVGAFHWKCDCGAECDLSGEVLAACDDAFNRFHADVELLAAKIAPKIDVRLHKDPVRNDRHARTGSLNFYHTTAYRENEDTYETYERQREVSAKVIAMQILHLVK